MSKRKSATASRQSNLGRWADNAVAGNERLAAIRTAIENELLAMSAMHVLVEHALLHDQAVFIGGTALRLAHGSPRFSEDLDFHIPPDVPRDIDEDTLARHMTAFVGAPIHARKNLDPGRSKLLTISAVLPERAVDVRRPRTKIDMGVRRQLDASPTIVTLKIAGGTVPGMGDLADPATVPTSSVEEIYADKHMALVGPARRIKHRDLFDLMWLRAQGVPLRQDLLVAKVKDAGPEREFADMLRQRADEGEQAILRGDYRAELSRFLPGESSWLFDEGSVAGMAGGFKTLVRDNARMLDVALNRAVVQQL